MKEVTANLTIELPKLAQDWGNRLLEGTNKTLHRDPGERSSDPPPQESDPNLPVSVQESPAEAWVKGGLLQDQGH